MELTENEKESLLAEFKAAIAIDNKADIEKINKLITEKLGDGDEVKALKKKVGELETAAGRPLKEGMSGPGIEAKTEDPGPVIYQDEKGISHKALRFNEPLYEGKEEDFSVGKILRAVILGNKKGLNELENKQASEGIGAAGGFYLSETISSRLVDLARNQMCVMKAGAGTIDMPTPEMRLVRQKKDPQHYYVAENEEVTEDTDWAIEPINLKAMDVAVLCRASRALLEDAENAGPAIEQAMSAAIALAVDAAGLIGNGVTSPLGLARCARDVEGPEWGRAN